MAGLSREERIARKKAILQAAKQQKKTGFDSPWPGDLKAFRPQVGKNRIRILPFPNNDHYALPVWVHYGVGPDNTAYLCLDQNEGHDHGECPICREWNRLRREAKALPEGPKKDDLLREASKLKAKERRLLLLVNRDAESDGIQYWAMPFSIDKNLIELAEDTDSGDPYFVEDIEMGHDVMFRKDGEGMQTKYTGEQIRPTGSPLSDSPARQAEWVSQLESITLEDLIRFYPAERIEQVFTGTTAKPQVETPVVAAPAAPPSVEAEATVKDEDISDFLADSDDDWA